MEEFKTEFSKCEGEQPQGGTGEMPQETGDYNPPAGEVTVSNGTLKLPENFNSVTTVTNGEIIKDDGTIVVTEDVANNQTKVEKPGETVDVKTNPDGKVEEKVTNAEGVEKETDLDATKAGADAPGADAPGADAGAPGANAAGGGAGGGSGGGSGGAGGAGDAATNAAGGGSSGGSGGAKSPVSPSGAAKASNKKGDKPTEDAITDQKLPPKAGGKSRGSKKSESTPSDSSSSSTSAKNSKSSKNGKGRPSSSSAIDDIPSISKYDIGHYDVWVDKDKKCTVHEKEGKDNTKLEKVQDCYQKDNIIHITFHNGDKFNH